MAEAKSKDFEHGFKGKNEPKNSANIVESAVVLRLFGSSTVIMDILLRTFVIFLKVKDAHD